MQHPFAAGDQKKPKHCRVINATKERKFDSNDPQFKTFFIWSFYQAYKPCKNQSPKYCKGNIHSLKGKMIKGD